MGFYKWAEINWEVLAILLKKYDCERHEIFYLVKYILRVNDRGAGNSNDYLEWAAQLGQNVYSHWPTKNYP